MSHPGAAHADGVRRIEILSITWERIQITIRLRPLDGRPFDPDGIRLRHAERGTLATPTRARREGDVVVIRCNVMQGPGQRPLDPGTWAVVSVVGTLVATLMVAGTFPDAADDAQGDLDAGTFDLDAGRYLVRPRISPDAALALEVVMEASNPKGSLPARVIERIRRTRLVAFSALLLLLRAAARRNGRRILFTSDSRASLGGNLQQVHARMVERGLDRHYELLTLFKPSITVRRGLRDRLRLPWLLARADTIVIDDYQPVISRLDARHSRIVQLWHAWGAFKTVGYSRVGKPGGVSPYARVHKNYAAAIASSEAEVPCYAEAFGIPEARVHPTGIPRMDRFWDPALRRVGREAALAAYPAARGRTVYLFAPTFRGDSARTAWYDETLIDYPALHALCVEKDAICLIRMHPFVRTPLDIPAAYADRIIDGSTSSIDINDVLFATDLLITDYSSVVFEFSTMDRPMLFFAPDLEEYIASRDFYVDYAAFVPGRIVRTFADLLDAIRREDHGAERLAAFRATHLDRFDGQATDRVIDLIIAGREPAGTRGS